MVLGLKKFLISLADEENGHELIHKDMKHMEIFDGSVEVDEESCRKPPKDVTSIEILLPSGSCLSARHAQNPQLIVQNLHVIAKIRMSWGLDAAS